MGKPNSGQKPVDPPAPPKPNGAGDPPPPPRARVPRPAAPAAPLQLAVRQEALIGLARMVRTYLWSLPLAAQQQAEQLLQQAGSGPGLAPTVEVDADGLSLEPAPAPRQQGPVTAVGPRRMDVENSHLDDARTRTLKTDIVPVRNGAR